MGLESLRTILKAGSTPGPTMVQILTAVPYGQARYRQKNLSHKGPLYLLPLTASMIIFMSLFFPSHLLQPDLHSLLLGLFLVNSFMIHCQSVPKIFSSEGRREGKKRSSLRSDSQYKIFRFSVQNHQFLHTNKITIFKPSSCLLYVKKYLSLT